MSETVAIKEHDRLFDLYDADGFLVGKANPGKKVMLADAFYVPERTCRMEYNKRWSYDEYYPTQCYNCSECGHMTYDGVPTFCPNCGAKVVDDD